MTGKYQPKRNRETGSFFLITEGGGHLYPVSNAFLEAVKENTRLLFRIFIILDAIISRERERL